MKRTSRLVWNAGLALTLACSSRHPSPVAPAPLPPQVASVTPVPRAAAVRLLPEIWAEFATPLDPATVSDRTVYLKIDDRRQPITAHWDGATRRVLIAPQAPLALYTTYTVELSPGLKSADGASLGSTFDWQFTTISVRLPANEQPPDSALGESPFVTPVWGGNETTPGPISYQFYFGDDSSQVARHAVPPFATTRVSFLPRTRWADGRHWWTVTAINHTTGEQQDGQLWWFETPPPQALDSLDVNPGLWGYITRGSRTSLCTRDEFWTGPDWNCNFYWSLNAVPLNQAKLAGARMEMSVTLGSPNQPPTAASVWLITQPWSGCPASFAGPPSTDETSGRLATGVPIPSRRMRYSSDALTAHLEAMIRRGSAYGFGGYLMRSDQQLIWVSPLNSDGAEHPRLTLYFYSPPPAARAAR